MLVYSQSKGEIRTFGSEKLVGTGYSGNGEGKNNPKAQYVKDFGPIPRGYWRIGAEYDSKTTGPFTIPLYKLDKEPGDDKDSQSGRSAFRIHGDSSARPGNASHGCIVAPRVVREIIARTGSEILQVKE